jgi:DNA-binding IclR family transcriptional regulator
VDHSVSGIGVLDKAVAIIDAMDRGPRPLSELVATTGLPKATVHRLALAMETHGLVQRDAEGRFGWGVRLVAPSIASASRPALEHLRDATGESTQLYVRRGDVRVCVAAVESPHSLRTIVPVGAALPLDRGSAGKALRGEGPWSASVEEREKGVASVSAPVVHHGRIFGAVSVSGPVERMSRSPGRRHAKAVLAAATEVEEAMGWR